MDNILAASRQIVCQIDIYADDILKQTLLPTDYIVNAKITRLGNTGKFWGYTYCQQLEVSLLDKERELDIDTGDIARIKLGCVVDGVDEYQQFPDFYITTASRDEKDNTLNITAHDIMWLADKYKWSDLNLVAPYTINDIAAAIGIKLNVSIEWGTDTNRTINYTDSANYDGTESLRQVLEDIAEITGTICFISNGIKFKVLAQTGTPYNITRDDYFDLTTQKAYGAFGRLIHQTELGDNVDIGTEGSTTQILVENGLVSKRTDITSILTATKALNDGLTIYPYKLSWRGDPSLELGDRIQLTTKDGDTVTTYLLSDTFSYDGGLISEASFDRGAQVETSPVNTIGNALKTAKATVDKANQRITLLAQDTTDRFAQVDITTDNITGTVNDMGDNISELQMTSNQISATVTSNKNDADEVLVNVQNDIASITNTLSTTMTSEDIQIAISSAVETSSATSVQTTTTTVNNDGLTIEKTGNDLSVKAGYDGEDAGFYVKSNEDNVLAATNQGVDALNFRASGYLEIGENIRLEMNQNSGKMCCYWFD